MLRWVVISHSVLFVFGEYMIHVSRSLRPIEEFSDFLLILLMTLFRDTLLIRRSQDGLSLYFYYPQMIS